MPTTMREYKFAHPQVQTPRPSHPLHFPTDRLSDLIQILLAMFNPRNLASGDLGTIVQPLVPMICRVLPQLNADDGIDAERRRLCEVQKEDMADRGLVWFSRFDEIRRINSARSWVWSGGSMVTMCSFIGSWSR